MGVEPRLPDVPERQNGEILGVGVDLVHIPGLAHQLTIPGTVFAERAFTARELRDAARRADATGSLRAEHLAGRWAAKEAFIKAWSAAANTRAGHAVAPQLPPEAVDWREIELVGDRWGRPSLRLTGTVAEAVAAALGEGGNASKCWPVSLTHDGDWAAAIVLYVGPSPGC
ncbi:holo-ACP synthase AcpS [Actinomyces ruminicola]|uniref:Holo-[acyl-carrier-protein] synthase n=1 Tax=Actinomyces ruminicola TaxID=332524 RepID=A0A1G9UNY3_9ACTO|nr:holo-ACP synthase [Actinomyces ruminicola]SDM61621.1 holo-[acyl-carrier protein] synthase [Actinomyces ruminicola]